MPPTEVVETAWVPVADGVFQGITATWGHPGLAERPTREGLFKMGAYLLIAQ